MNTVKSAQRIFEILEYFERHRRAASVSDIAREYDFPISSVSMLMRTMVELGYMEYRSSERTYQPTSRLLFLVEWIGTSLYDSHALQALCSWLSDNTNETVLVGMQNGMRLQYVQVIEASGPVRLNVSSGEFRDLITTAMGQVLLARHDDGYIDRFLRRLNAECDDSAQILDRTYWMALLRNVRESGTAVSVDGVVHGGGAVAMLLPEKFGATPLVLGVASVTRTVEDRADEFKKLMRKAIDYAGLMIPAAAEGLS